MNNNFYKVFVVLAFAKAILLTVTCKQTSELEEQIAQIQLEAPLELFHLDFKAAGPAGLDSLKQVYPELFPQQFNDQVWIDKMSGKDTIYDLLHEAVVGSEMDFEQIHDEVKGVMRHVKYYFPDFNPTPVTTVISEVQYRNRVTPSRERLLIGIDNYLGVDHELYQGISNYRRDQLTISQIPADAAMAYAYLFVRPTTDRTLLGSMIYFGKLHYLQELFAPAASGATKFETTTEKFQFMEDNEVEMWRYFVDRSLLYSTDSKLLNRFILPAPFSKFYLEVDKQTPGGVGKYVGYQIVKSFMNKNEVPLDVMLRMPARSIFEQSAYKPLP